MGMQRLNYVGSGNDVVQDARDLLDIPNFFGPSDPSFAQGYGQNTTTDVTVRAPARELLLVLNRRLDPARQGVEITGDRALFTHWLEHSRF